MRIGTRDYLKETDDWQGKMADLVYWKLSVYAVSNKRTNNEEIFINILYQRQSWIIPNEIYSLFCVWHRIVNACHKRTKKIIISKKNSFRGKERKFLPLWNQKFALCSCCPSGKGQQKKASFNSVFFLFFLVCQLIQSRERVRVFLTPDFTAMSTWVCLKPTLCGAIALEELDGQGQKQQCDSDSVLKKKLHCIS